jgi:hypothetical protein
MSEPDDLAQPPRGDEAWGGELPAIIHLPDQSQPEPSPEPALSLRRNGRAVSTKPGSQISRRRKVKDPRSARLDIRCRPAVRAKAEAGALAAGISVAGYVEGLIDDAPAPRVHRRATVEVQELARMRAEQSKRGGNLNQCSKNLNIIRRLAGEGATRDRLTEMIAEMLDLYRGAIAEVDATCAELDRALGLRPGDDY